MFGEVGSELGKVRLRRQCIPVGGGGTDRAGDGFGLSALDAGRFEVACGGEGVEGDGAHVTVLGSSAVGVRSAG